MSNFINPYSFVPLATDPPNRTPRQDETAGELYTGKIQYKIETLSSLFIPNTSCDKAIVDSKIVQKKPDPEKYHKSYDFFSYHDLSKGADPKVCYEPVIPGSELRGMVRSVYEAMTNSCLSAVDEDVNPPKNKREVYKNKLSNILRDHKPCSEVDSDVCPACRLFGTVNRNLQIASKIRFSDAYVTEKLKDESQYYDAPIRLLELATPRLSAMEFYLKRPEDKDVMNWTYDDYVVLGSNGKPLVKQYGTVEPQISGRKFYWHSPETVDWLRKLQNKKNSKGNDIVAKTHLNKTIRPLKKGIAFQGELFFDGITKSQLDELIMILNISELEKKGKYALKLGGAKPFGFGSVTMQVDKVMYRTLTPDKDGGLVYTVDNSYEFDTVTFTKEARDSGILTILDMKALENQKSGNLVHYPRIDREAEVKAEEGFKWFARNKKGRDREQIVYREYMHPLVPELASNEKVYNLVNSKGSGGGQSYKDSQQYKGGQWHKGGQSYKGDQSYKGSQSSESTLKVSIFDFGQNKSYKAQIMAPGKVQQGNKKFMEYRIAVDSDEFRGKECTLSAPLNHQLSVSDTIDVIHYKGKTFRLPK